VVTLGANNLTVGANKLSTAFSGVISGTGSLTKIGSGTLTLRGANTYTGKTLVRQGKLTIQDRTGSLMVIKGSITVDGGTFGGSGLVGGAVAVGSVSGRPSVLEPNLIRGGNFIIQKSLIFNPAATCDIDVNSDHGQYSSVWADSVTISEGAQFTITDVGNSSFGPVNLIMINNTGSLPIAGEFSNLPEGGSITVGQNTFYATYHGGDGNDLLLTTVPP
jgi:fibronectin-binding autotransporter adhesin